MKTLKQLLLDHCDECAGICEQLVIDAIKEWLTEKRQKYNEKQGEFWSLQVDKEYLKLLEDLKE
jgi:hypothetical protein